MGTLDAIYQLAEQRREKFLKYEELTQALLDCDADSAENYIIQRGELANEIDGLTQKIGQACDRQPGGKLILDAAQANADYSTLPPEYHPLFDVGQATRSVVYRIQQTEEQALARLTALRDEAKEKVRENQHMPKIKKYLTDLGTQPENYGFTSGKA